MSEKKSEKKLYSSDIISCSDCINTIANALSKISYIKQPIDGNALTKTIEVQYEDFSLERENEVIAAAGVVGHDLIPAQAPSLQNSGPASQTADLIPNPDYKPLLYQGIVGSLLGIILLALSLGNVVIPAGMAMYGLLFLSLAVIIYSGRNIYSSAYYKAKTKQFSMDFLFSLSATVAFAASLSCLFMPGMALDMMMCCTAPLMFGFRNLGKYVQEKAQQGVLGSINSFRRIKKNVTRIEDYRGPQEKIQAGYDIYQLAAGDVIRVAKDDYIPTDGVCLHSAQINDVNITGEDSAQAFHAQENVKAGMQAKEVLHLRVTNPVVDSSLAVQQREMNKALLQKAPIQEDVEEKFKYFVPIIFLISLGCGLSIWFLYHDLFKVLHVSTAVIAGACPCSLAIIIPLAILIAWQKAKQYQLECYSAAAVDVADRVKFFSLDLYGTLTEGQPKIISTTLPAEMKEKHKILQIIYAIEECSKHAVAKAICAEIKKNHPEVDLEHLPEVISFEVSKKGAVQAILKMEPEKSEKFIIGSQDFLLNEAQLSVAEQKQTKPLSQISYLFSVTKSQQLAVFESLDHIRPDAKQLITQLKAMGKEVGICTGSPADVAQAYAAELGINHVKSKCHGDEKNFPKVKEIKEWQNLYGKVAHIGDNWNDQSAFAESDLGIIVPSDSSKPIEEKDKEKSNKKLEGGLVEVKGDSLMPIVSLFALSKQMHTFINQVLCFSFIFNLCQVTVPEIIMVVDPAHAINPGISTALMIGQMLLILLYAYRFKQQDLPDFTQPVATVEPYQSQAPN